jgi:hypothetical protein
MKLNPKIYREAAKIADKCGMRANAEDIFNAYCCNAIYAAGDSIEQDANECYPDYVATFKEFFHPKRKEVTAETWGDLGIYGYWGKANKETAEYRVLALLLLAEMAKDT